MATASRISATLRYGESARLRLDFAPGMLIADCAGPPLAEHSAIEMASHAFQTPLDFPPIRRATVPGDRIVIALSPGVQEAPEIIAALLPQLLSGGAAAENISVVRSPVDVQTGAIDPRSKLGADQREVVGFETHDPTDRNLLSYLAADAQGEPIYMNRSICDADLVIPIGSFHPEYLERGSGKSEPWNDTLYPTFADRKTIDHLAPSGVPLTTGQHLHRQKQVDQIAWLLGVQFTVQVVPGSEQKVSAVLAGSPDAVFQAGREQFASAWRPKLPQRADLVIAAIGGTHAEQNWTNVGSALESALNLITDGGAVVLCTELNSEVGPALRQLIEAGDSESAHHRLRKQRTPDAPLARLLAEVQDRNTIYLLSRLDEAIVTPLGFAHVSSPEEIVRLASRYNTCILVADAQYARPQVVGE